MRQLIFPGFLGSKGSQ